ncbi:hypothetical protein K461DRAFT_226348 [Myriangium duriaei CBS 260.36]|uniref:Transcription factor domain-containing protein n=1 Tax=Myriangium duriaei CBS 260.36 TaxID=1168546 RepID=A0A9P4J3A7_9PEZI|nr:hypothetical protein K461DRAFT_226348 [Myriangium duriaei CBS 260.36]
MVSNSIAGQEDYVLNGEARGLLRLYGRGEADKPRNRSIFTYASQPDQLPAEEPAEAPPASPNLWDERAVLPTDSQTTDSFVDTRPLDLKDDTVWTLVERYKVHIHDLHPFLDFPTLQRYLPGFIERHRLSSYGPASPYAAANSESARKKRKRSEPYQNGVTDQYTQSSGSPSISSVNDTSLPAAITYLVLALGSVTDFQGYIPGPVPDLSSMPPPKIPFSPSATSRQSPASSWGAPTPPSHDGRSYGQSPAQSFDSPNPSSKGSRATNVDQIPGLNYYREACRIIGLHNDSNELTNAQARLLAGLYKGQLGRVQESWSWISDACRICRNPAKYRVRSLDTWQGAYENTILITCWSALQLESDILAELDYPHSGLASVQDQIPYPSAPGAAVPLSNNRTMTPMQYYVLQLYLRKRLNQMHVNVYAKACMFTMSRHMAATLRNNEDSLDGLRETYGWQDEEPPATDILEARVRGKFYGAKYICLRPYLDYVLHAMKEVRSGEALETLAKDAYGRPRHSDLKLYAAIATMTEEEIIERAKWCVESAILSTEAFDGVPGRLIMTNIVGTSHAQFSNMLVLSAAYHSGPPEIRDLIPPIRLKALLERTIKFISNLQLCSPTAKDDIKILNAIYRYSFGKSARLEPQDASGSFSSDMSV